MVSSFRAACLISNRVIQCINTHRLNKHYREVDKDDVDGPDDKRIRLSDIHDGLHGAFSPTICPQLVSSTVLRAFPKSQKKRIGKQGTTCFVGLEAKVGTSHLRDEAFHHNREELLMALDEEKEMNKKLQQRIAELESQLATQSSMHQHHEDSVVSTSLSSQLDALIRGGISIHDGPDTPAHFNEFSISKVIRDLQHLAPEVLSLFSQLGGIEGEFFSREEQSVAERKVVMSLCTLLNARSARAKGVQLLISFMLIARATSKQASV